MPRSLASDIAATLSGAAVTLLAILPIFAFVAIVGV